MGKPNPGKKSSLNKIRKQSEGLRLLSRQILQIANSGLTRTYFLRKISQLILDFFKAGQLKMLLRIYNDPSRYEVIQYSQDSFKYNFLSQDHFAGSPQTSDYPELYDHWKYILLDDFDISLPFFKKIGISSSNRKSETKSLLVAPFLSDHEKIGIIEFHSSDKKFLSTYDPELVETFIQTLGITLLNQYTQAALLERVKELTCLYGLSQIAEQSYVALEDLIHRIIDLLPPAWQYPDITRSRIMLDGIDYSIPGLKEEADKLSADIIIDNKNRGKIEVMYVENRPVLDEGPFLKEERKLLDLLAKELARIIEKRESDNNNENLQNQLHHADRLATVGELAAGVAHELNEPLGNILGFAQLAGKDPEVPDQVKKDLDKIIKSSLHAREIINKLMFFSRQVPAIKGKVDLNSVVEDNLYFFKSRCYKDGIQLTVSLEPNLPPIIADPVQINQVLINIIVNAIHAMPGGGTLEIKTLSNEKEIILIIKDTGHGMNKEIKEQIFNPFFTTKKAGMGIGLGLSVVHGIVSSYNGLIKVDSQPNKGTQFQITLPINNK